MTRSAGILTYSVIGWELRMARAKSFARTLDRFYPLRDDIRMAHDKSAALEVAVNEISGPHQFEDLRHVMVFHKAAAGDDPEEALAQVPCLDLVSFPPPWHPLGYKGEENDPLMHRFKMFYLG